MRIQPDKQLILDSIVAIAKGAGRAPSQSEFVTLARISDHAVSQFFPTWNDAVRAAGLQPHTLNIRLDDRELLEDWGHAARKNRKIPARRTYRHLGKYDHRTIERRFGPWSRLPEVFRNFAQGKPEWADVVALLPVPATKTAPHSTPNRPPKPLLAPALNARLSAQPNSATNSLPNLSQNNDHAPNQTSASLVLPKVLPKFLPSKVRYAR